MVALPLDEVRRLARELGLKEVQFNEHSKVVAFLSDDGTRFNVYYTTGTVGTYLLHPRQGKTQLFRRNVSLALLKDIFRTPRIHTDFGYHRRRHDGTEEEAQRKRARTISGGDVGETKKIDEEEIAATKQLVKLIAEKAALEKEIKAVGAILRDHERRREEKRQKEEEERRRQQEEERRQEAIAREDRRKEMRRKRGVCASWVLYESDAFKKNFDDYTRCVAVAPDGVHLCLYDNGGWAYSSCLPDNLHRLLHTRASSHPSPVYVSMGTMDRYYIRFTNGKSEWVGPQNLTNLLQKTNKTVKSVAFGEDYDDYFVVFEDGGYQYVGCPMELEKLIDDRNRRGDLEKVTLGPSGEWSLWAKNGKAWWGGLSDDMHDEVCSLKKQGNDITDLQFGNDGYYFIRFA